MPRVICTLPNTSDLINGVRFTLDRDQAISEEISEEVAANFVQIEGYVRVPEPTSPGTTTAGKGGRKKATTDSGATEGDAAGTGDATTEGGTGDAGQATTEGDGAAPPTGK